MDTIQILLTGGTIDSHFEAGIEEAVVNKKSSVMPYLVGLNLNSNLEFKEICMKDSRDMDDLDRKKLLENIIALPSVCFLVTHGTFTMAKTGQFLLRNFAQFKEKVVILTGSMTPLSEEQSDAGFNLGFAMALFGHLKPGVYLAMNGEIFYPDNVRKNLEKGLFEPLG